MITEFTIGCRKVINLGNYQSIHVEAGLTISVSEDADYDALKAQAQKDLRILMDETYRAEMAKAEGP